MSSYFAFLTIENFHGVFSRLVYSERFTSVHLTRHSHDTVIIWFKMCFHTLMFLVLFEITFNGMYIPLLGTSCEFATHTGTVLVQAEHSPES